MITLREVLEGTQGRLLDVSGAIPATDIRRVWHDSRDIQPGDLYVAIIGERLDGHQFVAEAKDRGCVAALVDAAHADHLSTVGLPLVVVDDTIVGLQRLASYWRSRLRVRVIGITGSVGKSSTKEVIWKVASQRYRTHHSRKSFNNEIGLPLTLLELTPETEVVVLEMGTHGPGEITELTDIAHPQIGVVTNVSHSHLGRMGSLEVIARAKTELPASLPADGFAVLNGDDARVRAMAPATRANVIFYGTTVDCDVRAARIESHGLEGVSFDLIVGDFYERIRVPLLGAHSAYTVMAAVSTGLALGLSVPEMLPGLVDPSVRMRLLTIPGPNGSTIIDDTYNSSPTSSQAAIQVLAEVPAKRRIAAFGDMLELGDYEEEGHRLVGQRLAEVVDGLYTMGERARLIADEALRSGMPAETVHQVPDKPALAEALREGLGEGDYVLIKGSRGIRLEDVVSMLRQDKLATE